mmetsp:Transcript_69788/g.113287  ORF Transcript_69788/g.113287 Transcript_69788/m.113287 type:complete len:223 (-) Transcript_69788:553-1221(-)
MPSGPSESMSANPTPAVGLGPFCAANPQDDGGRAPVSCFERILDAFCDSGAVKRHLTVTGSNTSLPRLSCRRERLSPRSIGSNSTLTVKGWVSCTFECDQTLLVEWAGDRLSRHSRFAQFSFSSDAVLDSLLGSNIGRGPATELCTTIRKHLCVSPACRRALPGSATIPHNATARSRGVGCISCSISLRTGLKLKTIIMPASRTSPHNTTRPRLILRPAHTS